MNYLLEVCLVVLTFTTSITPTIASGTEATASRDQAMQKGISVELPITSNAAPMPDADNEGALIVSITDSSGVYFGIDPIAPAALSEKVKASLSSQKMLYIKADARAPYADVMQVLHAARSAGVEATTLLTAQRDSPELGAVVPPKGLEVLIGPSFPSGSVLATIQLLNSGRQQPILKINHEQISWETLESALKQLLQNRSGKLTLLTADRLLPFADVVQVIDICQATGAKVLLVAPTQ